ncbi:MAG: hypothetical protein ACPGUY_10090, partial [Akkermansiaceae bacterium]
YNTLSEIDLVDEKAMALISMARSRQRQGAQGPALALLEDASRTSEQLTSNSKIDRVRADMAVVYAERHESDTSLTLADNITDKRRRDNTYRSLAGTLARSDLQAAQESVSSISDSKIRLAAEENVARTLARVVTPDQALRTARLLNPGHQRVVFLLEVSKRT